MDEAELFHLVQQCKHLKFRFRGVFAADNFPKTMRNGSFMIVNASKANHPGTHWTLIFRFQKNYHFADPLGLPLDCYKNIKLRLSPKKVSEVLRATRIQPLTSDNCGLVCIFIAQFVFHKTIPHFVQFDDLNLLRFSVHMF